MGYIATDLMKVPASGFEWYVFMLNDNWKDDLRENFSSNFEAFADEIGSNALVVKGIAPKTFYNSVLARIMQNERGVKNFPLPALLVANKPFWVLDGNDEEMKNSKIMVFPIGWNYIQPEKVTDFLIELAAKLRESNDAGIEKLSKSQWKWLKDYISLKPNFFGFGIDLNNIIEKLFRR